MEINEEELKAKLTPEEYHVLREGGTEAPFSGKYYEENKDGMYHCKVCNNPLFASDAKFHSDLAGLAGQVLTMLYRARQRLEKILVSVCIGQK